MAHVHDAFKCVVIVEASGVHKMDPPFLNRFEKQLIEFELLLSPSQRVVVKQLRHVELHGLQLLGLIGGGQLG